MDERGSPGFQKVMERAVVLEDVLERARKANSRKFIKGY